MLTLKLLILIQVLITGLSAHQPEDVVFADPGNSVNLTCASNTSCLPKCRSWWYRRKEHDMWTVVDNTSRKTGSQSEANIHLVIDNVTPQDSGRYYCSAYDGSTQVFSKGTTLVIGDISAFNASIHLLTPRMPITHPFSIPLACVVYTAPQQVYAIWKISGTHIKGNMVFLKKPSGAWIVVNSISLSRDILKDGERITCEVWFNSSTPVSVHWKIPQSSNYPKIKPTRCCMYVRSGLTAAYLFLSVFSICLSHCY
ncbi:immunoglobulin lambda-1 light chain-like [Eleutherodactylus coqui]|uniref:immunoglobulin lambda-1 light chain-like n=1 Tax=Eleutherodactylus coqui TaxID=57060 RepID=UPI003462B926